MNCGFMYNIPLSNTSFCLFFFFFPLQNLSQLSQVRTSTFQVKLHFSQWFLSAGMGFYMEGKRCVCLYKQQMF